MIHREENRHADEDQYTGDHDIFAVGDRPDLEPVQIFAHLLDQTGFFGGLRILTLFVFHQQFAVIFQSGSRLLFAFFHFLVHGVLSFIQRFFP